MTMPIGRLLVTTLCAASIAAAGCGDISSKPSSNSSTGSGVDFVNSATKPGGGFGGGAHDSGVEESKLLSELSEAEVQTACDNFASYLDDTFTRTGVEELFCEIEGIFTAGFTAQTEEELRQTCAMTRDQCIAEGGADLECAYEDVADCDITVAEYEACTTARVEALAEARDSLRCENISLDGDTDEALNLEDLPECQALDACGEDSGGGAVPPMG